MRKMGNYNTHRVKLKSQTMTSQFSRNSCNKFRVTSQKAINCIQKHYIMVQPQKLVVPVPDKAQKNSPSKSRHTPTIPQRSRT